VTIQEILCREKFVMQYDPESPARYRVRLKGENATRIDLYTPPHTADVIGEADSYDEAAFMALTLGNRLKGVTISYRIYFTRSDGTKSVRLYDPIEARSDDEAWEMFQAWTKRKEAARKSGTYYANDLDGQLHRLFCNERYTVIHRIDARV
jgi:hypothetical protein